MPCKKYDKRCTLQSAKQDIRPEHFKDIHKLYLKSIFSEYDIYSCLTHLFLLTYMCVYAYVFIYRIFYYNITEFCLKN